MQEIETKARAHAEARQKLTQQVTLLKIELERAKKRHIADLAKAVAKAQQTEEELLDLVAESGDLFKRPKSQVLHGIKLGFKKEKGRIEFDDADKVIKLIRKHYPELAELLIATTEKPSKEALNGLAAEQLKKIGVTVTADSEVAFVGSTDGDVDKLVNALLKGAAEEVTA